MPDLSITIAALTVNMAAPPGNVDSWLPVAALHFKREGSHLRFWFVLPDGREVGHKIVEAPDGEVVKVPFLPGLVGIKGVASTAAQEEQPR